MGFFSWLSGPSAYEREQAEKKAHKKDKFARYSSAEAYAEAHREDHGGWDEAIDAWENNKL